MKIFTASFLVFLFGTSNAFTPSSSLLNHRNNNIKRVGPTKLYLSTKTQTKDRKSTASPTDKASSKGFDYASQDQEQKSGGFSYVEFAKENPFANNLLIATTKTAAADLLAQLVIAQTPIAELDVQRSFLFCLFGAIYLGAFQYAYQVNVR